MVEIYLKDLSNFDFGARIFIRTRRFIIGYDQCTKFLSDTTGEFVGTSISAEYRKTLKPASDLRGRVMGGGHLKVYFIYTHISGETAIIQIPFKSRFKVLELKDLGITPMTPNDLMFLIELAE